MVFEKPERHPGDMPSFQSEITGGNFQAYPLIRCGQAAHVTPILGAYCPNLLPIFPPERAAPIGAVVPLDEELVRHDHVVQENPGEENVALVNGLGWSTCVLMVPQLSKLVMRRQDRLVTQLDV